MLKKKKKKKKIKLLYFDVIFGISFLQMYGLSWRERQQGRIHRNYIIGFLISLCIISIIIWIKWDIFTYAIIRNASFTRQCIPSNVLLDKSPSIGIVMSYETDYYGKLGELSEQDKREYAKKHNYKIFVNNDILDSTRKPSWFKVLMTKKHLKEVDWIFYVDTDTIIIDHDRPLTSYL